MSIIEDGPDFDLKPFKKDRVFLSKLLSEVAKRAITAVNDHPNAVLETAEILDITDRPGNYEDFAFVRFHFKEL